jgi:hypothetical protein
MSTAYDKVKKVTAQIKNSYGVIYGLYALSYWCGKLFARYSGLMIILEHSMKFTAGFSNTPGPLKPFKYLCPKTNELMKVITSNGYVNLAGNFGFNLAALSSSDKISLSIVTDENVVPKEMNKKMVASISNYIEKEIEKFEE